MGPRTLLSIALTVLMLGRALIALVWIPFTWAQTRYEPFAPGDDFGAWLEIVWHRHLLATACEVLLAAFVVLRPHVAPAFLLPPPAPGRPGLRPWLEAGIALVAFDVALRAGVSLLMDVVLPFARLEVDTAGGTGGSDLRAPTVVLGIAVLFLFLPRLGRVLSPARPAEASS